MVEDDETEWAAAEGQLALGIAAALLVIAVHASGDSFLRFAPELRPGRR